jgi:hypothetical protein
VIQMNRAGFAPRVAWQARMGHRIYIACAHALTSMKPRGQRNVSTRRDPFPVRIGTFSAVSVGFCLADPGLVSRSPNLQG